MLTDTVRRHIFDTRPLAKFWTSCQAEFPELATKAVRCRLPFPTTYFCESGFSTLAYIKNKQEVKVP